VCATLTVRTGGRFSMAGTTHIHTLHHSSLCTYPQSTATKAALHARIHNTLYACPQTATRRLHVEHQSHACLPLKHLDYNLQYLQYPTVPAVFYAPDIHFTKDWGNKARLKHCLNHREVVHCAEPRGTTTTCQTSSWLLMADLLYLPYLVCS
jgi:hypothetical protein